MSDVSSNIHAARPWSSSIRGLHIEGLAWGNPQAHPVLALHGWQDNAASFIPLMSHVMSWTEDLYVVAPDLLGHGRSAWRPHQSAYHFVDWLRDIHDLLQKLSWPQYSMIGHSMGAGIASLWAGLYPKRCVDLVLIEGLGPLSTPAHEVPEQLAKALQTSILPFRERSSLDELVRQRCKLTPMKPENAHCLMTRSTQVSKEGKVQLLQDPMLRMPSLLRFTEDQVQSFMGRITCRTLLIKASDGWPFDPSLMQQRLECLALVHLEEIEGQHHVHMDDPAQVARLCYEFWNRA